MKKLFTLLTFALTLGFFSQMSAQTIVSTDPQPRNVILEEFTGIHCGWCPAGHIIANQLIADFPGKFFAINVHVGGYATPGAGEPDFRTKWGTAIVGQTGLTGYPAGSVNRQLFTGSGTAMSRSVWGTYSAQVMGETSPLNVATTAKWLDTETIEIKVEVYFTADVDAGSLLNVAFLESGVLGYQSGSDDSPYYNHKHILRDLLTGQWGEDMQKGATGDFFEKTFSYKPGADYNPFDNELQIVAFVTKGTHQYIYSGGGTDVEGLPQESELVMAGDDAVAVAEGQATEKEVTVTNKSEAAITYTMSIDKSADTPADWTVEITDPTEDTFTLAAGESAVVKFIVNPGETRGYSVVTVTAQESGSTYNLAYSAELTTVSTEYEELMLVTAKSGSTIPAAVASSESPYANIETLPGDIFEKFSSQFTNLETIIWDNGNEGSFTPAHANIIKNAVDNGMNVVLLGAMTAFVLDGAGSLPSLGIAIKGESFNGYNYQAGTIFDFKVTGFEGDPITGDLGSDVVCSLKRRVLPIFTITDAETTTAIIRCAEDAEYASGNNVYPLKAEESIFGIRYNKGEQRVVYMSENPTVFKNSSTAAALTEKILAYVAGTVSVEEFDAYFNNMTASPNPFSASTTVEF
ncbi:MAG: Omp28-related outer membrane protein, partial [Chlorobi bacterium]|nr:Omp28-related outer membrane protein [Chlorobiota bacterium]